MAAQQKIWIDGRGQEVPSSYVSKYDKARDRAVRREGNARALAAAKEAAFAMPRKVGVKSADVLGIASETRACEDEEEPVEEAFNPLAIR